MADVIVLEDIVKQFTMGDTILQALDHVNFSVEEGDFVAIMGPSGSGKSTMMNILGCLDRPTSGKYYLDGKEVAGLSDDELARTRNAKIGFVFQNFNLLSKISAQQNVALPLVYAGVSEEERMERARIALRDVGLEDRLDHKPNELSGGQRQRVAIARALINNPAIVMADEPTGNLDTKSSYEIMDIFKKLNAMGKTIVMVTHEPDIGQQTKRILVMRDGHLNSDERLVHDAMVSLGFGVKEQIKDNISRLGSNLLIVQSGGRTATGARIQAGSGARLTDEDAKAIEKNIDGIKYVAPMVSRGYQLVVGNQNWTTNVQGSTPNIIDIRDYTVEEGRNINDHDMAGKDRVCVIGKTIVDNLFPDGDPIGKTIRINKAPFKVVGVLGAKGQSSGGQDQDDVVFVPLTTAMNRMMGITYVNNITIQAMNENVIDSVQAEVEHLLRIRHRIKNSDDDDFSVRNLAALMDTMMSTANTITMLLGCIAAISLLVGGIGIMNIMLVSVTERTREIGIRKALGATYNNILLQFLIESAVIGIIGGFLGVLLGIGASYAISTFAEWKTVISVPIIIISVVFSVGIGVFFGIYPARKAALLDPIEALRYE